MTVAEYGLSGSGGTQNLHIPTAPEAASLLRHDSRIGEALMQPRYFDVQRVIPVLTRSLDEATALLQIEQPAYIKLDIEGPELEVLAGGSVTLETVVAIKSEVSFLPLRHEQGLAHDLAKFLWDRGFALVDFVDASRWRRGPHLAHPQLSGARIPYSRGQLIHGDYMFLRTPDALTRNMRPRCEPPCLRWFTDSLTTRRSFWSGTLSGSRTPLA